MDTAPPLRVVAGGGAEQDGGVSDLQGQPTRRGPAPPAVVITGAPVTRGQDRASRQRAYMITMGVRTLSFILAVVLPVPPWAKLILIGLAVVLPPVAVAAANIVGNRRAPGHALDYTPREPAPVVVPQLDARKIIDMEDLGR